MYLIRLDDASEKMNIDNWTRIEEILDKYDIKPIVGIIPNNRDKEFKIYDKDNNFWQKALKWQNKDWTIAMHGYEHIYHTIDGGMNPVQNRSEFAGVPLHEQKEKIKKGYRILRKKQLNPNVFFAPSHTFDDNTLKALKEETDIHIVSDTIANDIYFKDNIYFIPQQSGKVRKLPFKLTTFCYHPNTMESDDFVKLEKFIMNNKSKFTSVNCLKFNKRKLNICDIILKKIYFFKRR